ncbi:phosphonate ABC transporter, permease protein PhnE [Mollicutes bacterium LVI A0039]|nr:phosphonate ABC transporter, permease protein PhnE [Mollicutes bacterium LVI A0039]
MKQSTLTLPNGKSITKPKSKTPMILSVLFILIVISSIITEADIAVLFTKADKFWSMIGDMILPPDFSYLDDIIPELIATLRMSVVGTFFGAIFGFPVAFLAAKNINSNEIVRFIVKACLSLTRTMPVLIYAMILTFFFGIGEFAGLLAITIFTFSIITKMAFEDLETLDMGAFEAAISQGSTRIKSTILTIFPQMMRTYITYTLYCFEINVRSAAILGYVGAGGIGYTLNQMIQLRQYDKAGMILIAIMVTVIAIDSLSQFTRRRLA